MKEPMIEHRGGCHCGRVRFSVVAPARPTVLQCNCSMCRRLGFLHLIVPKSRFKLLAGREALSSYRFGTGVAEHLFCRHCGVESFYIPRSNPDGYSVHAGCLDALEDFEIVPFDGAADWSTHAARIRNLSKE